MNISAHIKDRLPNSTLQLTCLLLSELSSSAWKFDILWDAWPHLEFGQDPHKKLGDALLQNLNDQTLFWPLSIIYDDVTFFIYIVGGIENLNPKEREAYKIAYQSVRPLTFPKDKNFEPLPFKPTTEDEYLFRLSALAFNTPPETLSQAISILDNCAKKYEQKGRQDGVLLCRQNMGIFKILGAEEASVQSLALSLSLFMIAISSSQQIFAFEIILQWWKIFNPDFIYHYDLSAFEGDGLEDAAGLIESIRNTSSIFELNNSHPGFESVYISLLFFRVISGQGQQGISGLINLFSERRLLKVRERLKLLESLFKKTNSNLLDQVFADLLSLVNSQALSLKVNSSTRSWLDIEEFLLSQAMKRSKNEISELEFLNSLNILEQFMENQAIRMESMLYNATHLLISNRSLGLALLQALKYTSRFTKDDKIINKAQDIWLQVTERGTSYYVERANKYLKEKKYSLVIHSYLEAAKEDLKLGKFDSGMKLLETGWQLIAKVNNERSEYPIEEHRLPDYCIVILGYGEVFGKALSRINRFAEAVNYIDQSLAYASSDLFSLKPTHNTKRFASRQVLLHQLAAESMGADHPIAKERMYLARQIADGEELFLESCMTRISLSYFDYKNHDWENYQRVLKEAREHAELYRRSFPYEQDKINCCIETQGAYIYALDKYFEFEEGWEAIAVLESLRSRVLLDTLGLSESLKPKMELEENLRNEGEVILTSLRNIAYPGHDKDNWALRNILPDRMNWIEKIKQLDIWLKNIIDYDATYADLIAGKTLSINEIQSWSKQVNQPTAVVYWVLGDKHSYQIVLLAKPDSTPQKPILLKVSVTLQVLKAKVNEFMCIIKDNRSPSIEFFQDLSDYLIAPIAPYIDDCDLIYFCPAQGIYDLPVGALFYKDQPLNTVKKVSIIPSLSVLRVLNYLNSQSLPDKFLSVYGPEFEVEAEKIANIVQDSPSPKIYDEETRLPLKTTTDSCILHLICHGFFDERDSWSSGFIFKRYHQTSKLTGSDITRWKLRTKLVFLEACETGRQVVTITEDTLGLDRFFHIAGIPAVLLCDWKVRFDVAKVFANKFYKEVAKMKGDSSYSFGEAYRQAMNEVYIKFGKNEIFLWAPFTHVGLMN